MAASRAAHAFSRAAAAAASSASVGGAGAGGGCGGCGGAATTTGAGNASAAPFPLASASPPSPGEAPAAGWGGPPPGDPAATSPPPPGELSTLSVPGVCVCGGDPESDAAAPRAPSLAVSLAKSLSCARAVFCWVTRTAVRQCAQARGNSSHKSQKRGSTATGCCGRATYKEATQRLALRLRGRQAARARCGRRQRRRSRG